MFVYWITRFVVIGNGNTRFLLLCVVIELKEGLKVAKILSSQAQYIWCKAKIYACVDWPRTL